MIIATTLINDQKFYHEHTNNNFEYYSSMNRLQNKYIKRC